MHLATLLRKDAASDHARGTPSHAADPPITTPVENAPSRNRQPLSTNGMRSLSQRSGAGLQQRPGSRPGCVRRWQQLDAQHRHRHDVSVAAKRRNDDDGDDEAPPTAINQLEATIK
jgi:hypothetical protein